MTSQQAVFYEFAISHVFKKRINRAFIFILIWLVAIFFFSYYVFTANAWRISFFGVNISAYYLPPIIAVMPSLYEELMLIKNYGVKSFQQIGVIDNTLMGKNFLYQKISMTNPIVADWNFKVKKHWFLYDNDPILTISFIKLVSDNQVLYIPHSQADDNFIKRLKELSG